MCRSVHVRLTEADQEAAARVRGVLIPVYGSIGLVLLAAVALSVGPREGTLVADADNAAPAQHAVVLR